MEFLAAQNLPTTLPVLPIHLTAYISHLHSLGRKHSTISASLTGISTYHKFLSGEDPTKTFLVSRTMQGIKKASPPASKLLPITYDLLIKIFNILPNLLDPYTCIAAQALFLLAYHGCFRI